MEVRQGKMILMPPAPHLCQQCAVDHKPEEPHNQQSMFYHVWYKMNHDREPTWKDAMEHCSEETKQLWIKALKERGVEV